MATSMLYVFYHNKKINFFKTLPKAEAVAGVGGWRGEAALRRKSRTTSRAHTGLGAVLVHPSQNGDTSKYTEQQREFSEGAHLSNRDHSALH